MAVTFAEARAYCPVFKNGGACPFATEEVKNLLVKFRTIPGFGPKQCPYTSEAVISTITPGKFDCLVGQALATKEGAALSSELKRFQAVCKPILEHHKGCPHFDNMESAADEAKAKCPAFKAGCPIATDEVKALLSKFQKIPGYGPKKCPYSSKDFMGTLSIERFDLAISEALATSEGAAVSADLKKFKAIVVPMLEKHNGCTYLENKSVDFRVATTKCPAFKDGVCPYVTEETKALLVKFRCLPGFGIKKCPHSTKESMGSMTKSGFDKIVQDLLATKEGAAMSADLKRFHEIWTPLLVEGDKWHGKK